MKFQLNPYSRNATLEEVVADIKAVALRLGKNTLTSADYAKHGRFSPDTARRRCGSWFKALSLAELRRSRTLGVSAQDCLADLKSVAEKLGKQTVTVQEYRDLGRYASSTVAHHLGSWFKALDQAGLKRTRVLGISNEEYFANLEDLWIRLGRQPNYAEVQKPFSKYSVRAYDHRFGSWRNALEAFVENMDQDEEQAPAQELPPQPARSEPSLLPRHKTSRSISDRLRFKVLRRDNFRCVLCGNSPAITPGVPLEPDHIIPWSEGGETVMDNLQTLCRRCNGGRSNLSLAEHDLNGQPGAEATRDPRPGSSSLSADVEGEHDDLRKPF